MRVPFARFTPLLFEQATARISPFPENSGGQRASKMFQIRTLLHSAEDLQLSATAQTGSLLSPGANEPTTIAPDEKNIGALHNG